MSNDQKVNKTTGTHRNTRQRKNKKWLILGVILAVYAALFILIGCGKPTEKPPGGDPDPPVVGDVVWSEKSDCGSCHVTEFKSTTDNKYGSYPHYQEGNDCFDCHLNTGSVLNKVHENYATGKVPTELKKTQVLDATCLTSGCHNKDDNKKATAASKVLTDAKGKVQNPHDMPDKLEHNTMVNCMSCHTMHKVLNLDSTARGVCLGCHHQNEYECYTCHEDAGGPK